MAVTRLTVVKGEIEAELLCGSLRAAGIPCSATISADQWHEGFKADAVHDVFIDDDDYSVRVRCSKSWNPRAILPTASDDLIT